jgi:hypothetical protein
VNNITLDSVVVRSGEVMASPVDDELVMIDLERGMYYGLDGSGAGIWELLAQPVRVRDLCTSLMQLYDVEQPVCEADVLAVLNEMAVEGLVSLPNEHPATPAA